MKIEVQKSFEKDISKVGNKLLASKILSLIDDIASLQTISDIHHLKKLHAKENYYRIRVGDYRLGFKVENDVVILLRFMHRKDIYKYFP